MAKIFPDIERTRVVFSSAAEEQFYSQAKATLTGGWTVFYSCTLSTMEGEDGLKDNEIDFVCYHPSYGIVVVEVKGGRIRFDAQTSKFYSVNRHNETFEIKDPFQQALIWKSRFLRFLKKNDIRVPVSHAVSFPSADEQEFPVSSGVPQEIIIGRNRIKNLELTLSQIALKSQPEQFLKFADVGSQLERLLVGSTFTTKMYLRQYIDGHESRVKDTETIQETLITPIAASRRLGVEGEAGTGKTLLALFLAKHFRDQGRSVLILGSNALLNLLLVRDVGEGIDIQTYPELAASFGVNLLIPPPEYTGAKEDWIQFEAPEKLKLAISGSKKRFDVVICDEAQDVQPFWWDPIETLVNPECDESRFYVFFDSSQGVFGAGSSDQKFVASEILPIKPPYFPLVHNYRTTREIASFSRAFRTGSGAFQSHCGRLGYIPEIISYKDAEDAKRLLGKLIRRLTREEGLNLEEITMLSARNPAARESVLYQTEELAKIPVHRLTHTNKKSWREAKAPNDSIGVTTIAGFKGLETPVGILLNVSEYNLPLDNPIMSSLIYVACTRAKHQLYIFVKEDDVKKEQFEKALAGIKSTGSLILEGSKSDFEFSGKITHYNPDRVGWLTVDDPAFEQGNIMFFPNDVRKADLGSLRVGMRIKFRPRVEGNATIACDLMLALGS
jgi:hypothetical protein